MLICNNVTTKYTIIATSAKQLTPYNVSLLSTCPCYKNV